MMLLPLTSWARCDASPRGRFALLLCAALLVPAGPAGAQQPAPLLPAPASDSASRPVSPADLLNDIESVEGDKAERLDLLQNRLQQLRDLLKQRAQSEPPAAIDPPEPLPPAEEARPIPEPPEPDLEPVPPVQSASTPEEPAPSDIFPTPVVEGPIDRLSLADSLFASGETELALQIYNEVDAAPLAEEDRRWRDYQLAGCYRRLKDHAEAERRYRALAGLEDGGWYADQSRWWLDSLTARKKLETDLERVTQTIQAMEQQLNAPSQP